MRALNNTRARNGCYSRQTNSTKSLKGFLRFFQAQDAEIAFLAVFYLADKVAGEKREEPLLADPREDTALILRAGPECFADDGRRINKLRTLHRLRVAL